ncbi:helix-turn-helix transcriptional regulator [Paraclostridium sordellii]|uniref:helix-turn-helix transcriptional regulator n=1 Tax=Paraclostridium sordellii TaxID=1505 RepID=UPI00070FE741|nr:helix-turn-helix transcriptional regulator [Paeniclostridium sordellii]
MNKIKYLRNINKMTQTQLGELLGVTPRYIAFLEKGERTPSLDIAFKIAKIFDTTIEDIFLND